MLLSGGVFVFFDKEFVADKLSEFGLDNIFDCKFGHLALGTHAPECNDDLVAFDVDQFHIAAVGAEFRSNLLVDRLLDELNLLDIGQLPGFGGLLGAMRIGLVALDLFDDLFNLAAAAAAATARLQ